MGYFMVVGFFYAIPKTETLRLKFQIAMVRRLITHQSQSRWRFQVPQKLYQIKRSQTLISFQTILDTNTFLKKSLKKTFMFLFFLKRCFHLNFEYDDAKLEGDDV